MSVTRALASFAGIALIVASQSEAQTSVRQLRALVARGEQSALVEAIRARPLDAREMVRQLVSESAHPRRARADSSLMLAQRAASAYAIAWEDSFPVRQVERFSRMTRGERVTRIAIDSIRRAGNDLLGRDGVDAALVVWRRALRMATAVGDTAAMAAALGNVGAGFYVGGQLDSAEAWLDRASRLAEAIGDRRTSANALVTLGNVAKDRGDLSRARILYERALAIQTKMGDAGGSAAVHNNLGLLSASLGDTDGARMHYDASLALARRHALPDAAATALLNLANAAAADGDFAAASRRYAEALAIHRRASNHADAALVLHNLGLLEFRRGDYRLARVRLNEALEIYARTGTAEDLIAIRRDLATVAAGSGDLRSALNQLRQANVLLSRGPLDQALAGSVALARADLSVQLNLYSEAERLFARSEALYRSAGDAAGEASAQQGRAMLLIERKRYDRALELLRGTSRANAATGDRRIAATTQLLIGYALQRRGDLDDARVAYRQAADSLSGWGDAIGEAAALSAAADVERESGAPLAAEALYRKGLGRLEGRAAPSVTWQLRSGLGQVLHDRGALSEASTELRAAIAAIERTAGTLALEERRTAFLADKLDVYTELALVERARLDGSSAFAVSERLRARQMLSMLGRGKVRRPESADSVLVEREQDLRRRIGELTQQLEDEAEGGERLRGADLGGATSGGTREALTRMQEQYAQIMLALRDDDVGLGSIVRDDVASWREVANRLESGEAFIEYLVSDSTTLAFVITADTLRVLDLGVNRRSLESLIDFTRGALVRPPAGSHSASAAPWRASLRRLHSSLIAPVEDAGVLTGIRRVIIVPHAELHYRPFAALIRPGRGSAKSSDEFLVERYDIAYTPSASVWLRLGARPAPTGRGVLAMAPRTKTLPGSRNEVEAIRALYGADATVLHDAAATEYAFRTTAPHFGIVHLATNGVLNKHNPLFSYVAMNAATGDDGRLEVHEVFGLTLNARLVVLSACQTALGSGAVSDVPAGDDWVGLARAFLGVGAANVIATLWPVEDRSTAMMMQRLHVGLHTGMTESAALTQAQRTALRNPATSDPFYWAGFVLIGGR